MKWLIAITALLVCMAGKAQDAKSVNTPETAFDTIQSTNAYVLGTNATPIAVTNWYVAPALYHTIHIVGTNTSAMYCIDVSIDNTNWFFGATNALASSVVAEATLTKKENFLRVRLQGTNQTIWVNYLGGR